MIVVVPRFRGPQGRARGETDMLAQRAKTVLPYTTNDGFVRL